MQAMTKNEKMVVELYNLGNVPKRSIDAFLVKRQIAAKE